MNPVDPNLAHLELIAAALGELRERFVFVKACAHAADQRATSTAIAGGLMRRG
jgi:hypothetical protein